MLASRTKLEKICAKNPTSILFARLADAFLASGDAKRAQEICRRGLRYRPSYVTGHVVMGKCHLASGRLEEARQEFQKALQLDADNLAAFWHLGQIDLQMGWEDLALQNFKRASLLDAFSRELAEQIAALLPTCSEESHPSQDEVSLSDAFQASLTDTEAAGGDVAEPPDHQDAALQPEAVPTQLRGGEAPDTEPKEERDLAVLVREIDKHNAAPGLEEVTQSQGPAQRRADPIATSTLAELYAVQGLVPRAIDVLEQVLARDPGNERVNARLQELREMASTSGQNSR